MCWPGSVPQLLAGACQYTPPQPAGINACGLPAFTGVYVNLEHLPTGLPGARAGQSVGALARTMAPGLAPSPMKPLAANRSSTTIGKGMAGPSGGAEPPAPPAPITSVPPAPPAADTVPAPPPALGPDPPAPAVTDPPALLPPDP